MQKHCEVVYTDEEDTNKVQETRSTFSRRKEINNSAEICGLNVAKFGYNERQRTQRTRGCRVWTPPLHTSFFFTRQLIAIHVYAHGSSLGPHSLIPSTLMYNAHCVSLIVSIQSLLFLHLLSDHVVLSSARQLHLPGCGGQSPCATPLRTLAPWPRTTLLHRGLRQDQHFLKRRSTQLRDVSQTTQWSVPGLGD